MTRSKVKHWVLEIMREYLKCKQGIGNSKVSNRATHWVLLRYWKYWKLIRNVGRVSEIWGGYWKCTKAKGYCKFKIVTQGIGIFKGAPSPLVKKGCFVISSFLAGMKTVHCIVDFIANKLRTKFDNANF